MTDDFDTPWRPLSVRESGDHAAYDALHPGVPGWLASSLEDWVERRVDEDDIREIERRCRISLKVGVDPYVSLINFMFVGNGNQFLDVVDFLVSKIDPHEQPPELDHGIWRKDVAALRELEAILVDAGSLWTVATHSKPVHLERRIAPTLQSAAEQIMSAGDKGAQHLRLAWHGVYGRHPDPGKGYGEAIKAMEVATIPVVCPGNPRATLGRVINDLRAKPGKWVVNLKHPTPDRQVEIVADMLDLIWKGQSDRHGDPDPATPVSVTQEQAEAAVHLAVTVVQWFNTGTVSAR